MLYHLKSQTIAFFSLNTDLVGLFHNA